MGRRARHLSGGAVVLVLGGLVAAAVSIDAQAPAHACRPNRPAGSCPARRTASPTSRATGPTKPRRRSNGWAAGRDADRRAGDRDRKARAGRGGIPRQAERSESRRRRPRAAKAAGSRRRASRSFVERISEAAGGAVGGYNGFWLDPGDNVIRIDGVARSSIIIDPPNGRIPALTDAGKRAGRAARRAAKAVRRVRSPRGAAARRPLPAVVRIERRAADAAELLLQQQLHHRADQGSRDDPDARWCTTCASSGSARPSTCRRSVRPWFGDSIGHWEGDTLVVETTNIHPTQLDQASILWAYRGASENLKVTERFTRTGPDTILYKFTMEDPATFTAPFTRRAAVQRHRRA